jgi:hypothetical protein
MTATEILLRMRAAEHQLRVNLLPSFALSLEEARAELSRLLADRREEEVLP